MLNFNLVRNRLKIQATIANAKATLKVQEEHGSLCDFLWDFVDHKPITNDFENARISEIPAKTELSTKISKDLKAKGFRFVGPVEI